MEPLAGAEIDRICHLLYDQKKEPGRKTVGRI